MTGEGEEQEKNKLRKEKVRVSESRELTEKRKGSSDRLLGQAFYAGDRLEFG